MKRILNTIMSEQIIRCLIVVVLLLMVQRMSAQIIELKNGDELNPDDGLPYVGAGGVTIYDHFLDQPWHHMAWLGTHNSYANNASNPSPKKEFSYSSINSDERTQNQYHSIEGQLELGARFISLDLVTDDDGYRKRLSNGNHFSVRLIHGRGANGTRNLYEELKRIKRFLDEHSGEIIILNLDFRKEKYIKYFRMNGGQGLEAGERLSAAYESFTEDFADAKLEGYAYHWDSIFEPEQHRKIYEFVDVSAVAEKWMELDADNNQPTIRELLTSNKRLIINPMFIEDIGGSKLWPHINFFSTHLKKNKYGYDVEAYLPENMKVRQKGNYTTYNLYLNANEDNSPSADKIVKQINNGDIVYNMGLKIQEGLDELNQGRSTEDSIYLTIFETQFYQDEETSMVEAINRLNSKVPPSRPELINQPLILESLNGDFMQFPTYDGALTAGTAAINRMMIMADHTDKDYVFFRNYGRRKYAYLDNSNILKAEDEITYDDATLWKPNLVGSDSDGNNIYTFERQSSSPKEYLTVQNGGLTVSTQITDDSKFKANLNETFLSFKFNGDLVEENGNTFAVNYPTNVNAQYNDRKYLGNDEKCLKLSNSNSAINLSTDPLRLSTDRRYYTIDFWFKSDQNGIDRHILNTKHLKLHVKEIDKFRIYWRDDNGDQHYKTGTSDQFCDGQWHHIVITAERINNNLNKSQISIYIDGELDLQHEIKEGANYTSYLQLGADYGSGEYLEIDDFTVRLYKASESEISGWYDDSFILGNYSFDQSMENDSDYEHDLDESIVSISESFESTEDGYALYRNSYDLDLDLGYVYDIGDHPNFTAALWIKFNQLLNGAEIDIINGDTWGAKINTDDELVFYAKFYGSGYNELFTLSNISKLMVNGTWHHLALQKVGTSYKLFLDGEYLFGQPFSNLDIKTPTSNIHLLWLFDGYIDNFYISTTVADIDSLYQSSAYFFSKRLAAYPLEEDLNDDYNFNHAIYVGNNSEPMFESDGLLGKSVLKLVGQEYIETPINYDLAVLSPDTLSVSFWFKTDTNALMPLMDLGKWSMEIDNGKLALKAATSNNVIVSVSDTKRLNDNAWHQVHASMYQYYDGGDKLKLALYVDGKKVGEQTSSGLIASTSDKIIIGANTAYVSSFIGYLSDVEILRGGYDDDDVESYAESHPNRESAGLLAYYNFEDTSTLQATDVTGNHHGTFVTNNGTDPEYIDDFDLGIANSSKALRFNGENHVDLGFTLDPSDYTGEMTVSLWMRTDGWQNAYERVIDGQYWKIIRDNSNDNLSFYSWNGADKSLFGASKLDDGLWHHVVITVHMDGNYQSVKRIWIDGVKEGYQYVTNPITGTNLNILLGKAVNFSSTDKNFNGDLDEVRIYSRLLDDSEIEELASEKEQSTIAYYKLNGDAYDEYGNHGVNDTGIDYSQSDIYRGEVAYFDGSSAIDLQAFVDNSELSTSYSSAAFWIKTASIASDQIIFFAAQDGENGFGPDNELHISLNADGTIKLFMENDDADVKVDGLLNVNDNEWHHIAVTWEAYSDIVVYLDGSEEITASHPNLSYEFNQLKLGSPNSNERFYSGYLDEVIISEDVLSIDEILELESPWEQVQIGSPNIEGWAWSFNDTITVNAAGSNISGNSDEGYFVYQSFSGDGEIIAKVKSLESASGDDKAGIMFREDLSDDAKNVFLMIKPNQLRLQYRDNDGNNTGYSAQNNYSAPVWLKLVRSGYIFSAYYSYDEGNTWTTFGNSQSIDMSNEVYVGMAVTSVNVSSTTTAVFDNISITSSGGAARFSSMKSDDEVLNAEDELAGKIAIYPNPSDGLMQVTLPEDVKSLSIIDLSGKVLLRLKGVPNQLELNLKHLNSGIYLIKVVGRNFIESRRIIID